VQQFILLNCSKQILFVNFYLFQVFNRGEIFSTTLTKYYRRRSMNVIGGAGISTINGLQGAQGLSGGQAGRIGNMAGLTARQVGAPVESPLAMGSSGGG
jgi:hypothetical protein